ncbi:MAG: hydroxymethylbilane synthase [Gammaproteobacteria bacterium]|nr:MAG: hydroxymethylbilane synthase [Gammaproteobacteria bacterium]
MMSKLIRIATRESPLALWQAEHVQARLSTALPGTEVSLAPMSTFGDRWQKTPLSEIGGKNLFVKELEEAILRGEADIAAHSMKDVASTLPAGFGIVAALPRENPFDVLVSNRYRALDELPAGAVIGTCSPRRVAQLRLLGRGFEIRNLRGNINTRLAKLDAGEYDAIILAAAGLERLGMHDRIAEVLPIAISLPAIGQGIVGIEAQLADTTLCRQVASIADADTTLRLGAERAFSHRLEGGCSAPMAGYCTIENGELHLRGRVIALDGSEVLEADATAPATLEAAQALGTELAERLIARGARRLLDDAEAIAAAARERA